MLVKCCINPTSSLFVFFIYRLPGYDASFNDEFFNFILKTSLDYSNILVLGDVNLWLDDPKDQKAIEFLNDISNANFVQHLKVPTHQKGHTLDILLTNTLSTDNILATEVF